MGPAELLDYDRAKLRGLVLEEGAATNHVAIVARALDIPVLGKVSGVLDKIEPLDPVIVDGDRGQIFIRPGEDIKDAFKRSLLAHREQLAKYAASRDLPAVTLDGVEVSLNVNAGLLLDIEHVHASGADGIGLYRTEIPFMARSSLPDVAAQASLYTRVLDAMQGKPVVFRTLDVGGDKVLPYWNNEEEDNPMMGWRSVRITLDRPMILRQQLRALIRSAAGRDLRLMFPMVAEVAEFDQARATLDLEMERERARGGNLPQSLLVGTMLEVPALLWQLPQILSRVDFISIGSNDLLQFLFASDRGNPRLSDRYDTLSPPVLRLLRSVAEQCEEAKVPLSLCGEMAGEPLGAMVLVSLGFRRLSMSAHSIGPVKAMVLGMDAGQVRDYVLTQLDSAAHTLRPKLRGFARDHGIQL
ncbi:MAG: phosphoenolpyruvate--protein phosphotransferase [Alphaproteobacteria bacterium RIFOXYD12_FULL_60_8]|nr:MAG: phosphoenolpyruvate--protein phosphotransferase [Alphaproteobacteria bacterium RIFOXYD12_FULL_60_8]